MRIIDINSIGEYPCNALSNLYKRTFIFEGVKCHSMEGFLQSLKFRDADDQIAICLLDGIRAKRSGRNAPDWRINQTLYWKNQRIDRRSGEYIDLLTAAYDAMFDQCPDFTQALIDTHDHLLTHSIGCNDPKETILTTKEFISLLEHYRSILKLDDMLTF